MRFFSRSSELKKDISRVEERISRIENQVAGIGNNAATLVSAQEAQAHVQAVLLEAVQQLTDLQKLLIARATEEGGSTDEADESAKVESPGDEASEPPLRVPRNTSNTTLNFEVRLAQAILPFLSNTKVIDVGACRGDFSIPLLEQGYEVTAIEPNSEQADFWEILTSNHSNLEFLRVAIASECGEGELHPVEFSEEGNPFVDSPDAFSTISPHPLPDGLVYGTRQTVAMETLASLAEQEKIPEKPGLLKIDAEGLDGVVIESLGDAVRPEVIFAEFWSEDLPLWGEGGSNSLDDLISRAHGVGCYWFFTLCTQWGSAAVSVDVAVDPLPEQSWGSAIFFRDFEVFRRSYRAAKRIVPGG